MTSPIGRATEQIAGGIERIGRLLSRRELLGRGLKAAAGAALAGRGALLPAPARGDEAVKTGQFVFPRLQFSVYDKTPDIWNVGPIGDVNLRKKLQELTNINVSQEPRVVHLGDFDDMCRNPFVFMTSEGYFKLPENEEKNLREFLERGGFIHADDCVYARNEDRFFRFYVELMGKLFPDNPMRQDPRRPRDLPHLLRHAQVARRRLALPAHAGRGPRRRAGCSSAARAGS